MLRLILIFAFWLIIGRLFAQNDLQHPVDSLTRVLSTQKEGEKRILTQVHLSHAFNAKGDYRSADSTARVAIRQSQLSAYPQGEMRALNALANTFLSQAQYDKSLTCFRLAIKIARNLNDESSVGSFYHGLGNVFQYKGNFTKALRYYQYSLSMSQKYKDKDMESNTINNIAIIYAKQGDYPASLNYFMRSAHMAEEKNSPSDIAIAYNNLGSLYFNMDRNEEGLKYFKKSMVLREKIGDQWGMASSYSNMGDYYTKVRDYPNALAYLQKSITIRERLGDLQGLSETLDNIGLCYFNQHQWDQALDYFEKAYRIRKDIGLQDMIPVSLCHMGDVYRSKRDFPTARTYYLQSYESAKKVAILPELENVTLHLAQTDSALGNFASAYRFYKEHRNYRDTIFNKENSEQLGRIEAEREYQKERVRHLKAERLKERERTFQRYIFGSAFGLVVLLSGFFYYRYRSKVKTNALLTTQNNRIEAQKAELAVKNEKIEDSIRYAYQIQTAILPDPAYLNALLPNCFIFYQPKDIVSGDFYWLTERENLVYFCVADCTGHGVPGAFMSVVGSNALHSAVNELGLTDAEVILHELDRKIRHTLHQEKDSESKDGMDICLCIWDKKEHHLQFAGAGRPLYHLSNGTLSEIKGDKFPIGGAQHEQKLFTTHRISLQKGDRIYLFSDGITDQFGGNPKKKFSSKRLQDFILTHHLLNIEDQGHLFHQTMSDWMSGQVQLDDLTLMAVEV